MAREYRNFTREEKIKAVKMVLIDKKSQMEVERTILGKKKCTGTINRWIREYIQEGEDNCFRKKKGLKKVEITEENVRYEILKNSTPSWKRKYVQIPIHRKVQRTIPNKYNV